VASAAWRAVVVGELRALAASLWPPRVLAQPLVVVLTPRVLVQVLAASLSKRPRVPARTPSHAMQPRGLVLQIAFVPTRALVLLGPF